MNVLAFPHLCLWWKEQGFQMTSAQDFFPLGFDEMSGKGKTTSLMILNISFLEKFWNLSFSIPSYGTIFST